MKYLQKKTFNSKHKQFGFIMEAKVKTFYFLYKKGKAISVSKEEWEADWLRWFKSLNKQD